MTKSAGARFVQMHMLPQPRSLKSRFMLGVITREEMEAGIKEYEAGMAKIEAEMVAEKED